MLSIAQYVHIYLIAVVIFFAIDMVWLGFVARNFYKKYLGHLLSDTVNWPVAIIFYLIFLVGLVAFVIAPAIEARNIMHAVIFGALFGFFTYLTYDLTNWATLRDWPAIVAFVDIVWGSVLSASVATLTYWMYVTFIIR